MEKGLISIIIPAYNCSDTLYRAVNSVLRQTYKKIELIIVDDGSTDSTPELCDIISRDYPHVIVRHKENGRQASARNAGIGIANGEFLLFLDSDDELVENCCETSLEAMEGDTDFVLYGFNVYSGTKLLRTPNPGIARYFDDSWEVFSSHVARLMGSPCNKLYRKEYVKVLFDETCVHGEDTIFNYSNFHKGTNIICISECLYNVHLDNPNSVNKSYKKGRLGDSVANINIRDNKLMAIFEKDLGDTYPVVGSGINRLLGEVFTMCSLWNISECVNELDVVFADPIASKMLLQKDKTMNILFIPIKWLLMHNMYRTTCVYCKALNLGNQFRKVIRL